MTKIILIISGIIVISIIFLTGVYFIPDERMNLSKIKTCPECEALGEDYRCQTIKGNFYCIEKECWHFKSPSECYRRKYCDWYSQHNLCCDKNNDNIVQSKLGGFACCPKGAICD